MLILKDSGALKATLKIRLAAAKQTNDLSFYTTYYDGPSSSFGDSRGSSNGTTPVTMVGNTIGQYRQIKYITLYNGDDQVSSVILEIIKTDGISTEVTLVLSLDLDSGDTLIYTENEGFKVVDINGKLKVTVSAGGGGGGGGTVTSVSVATAHGFSGTVANATSTPVITLSAGAITPTSVTATGAVTGSNLTGVNTGDQDLTNYFEKTVDDTDDITEGTTNKFTTDAEKTKLSLITITQGVDLDTLESDTTANNSKVTNATHTGDANGSEALTVTGINGIQLASLATGILKNTTVTGLPSIAVAADFPTLNQNTTGSAATLTTGRTINGVSFDGSSNITVAADASTLTGTALATNIVTSSLTAVGTLTNLTVTNPINGTSKGINGVQTSSLATGILKNTTTTGVPSIAVAADFPTLNQNTTGSAATLTTPRTINGVAFNGSANITVTADGSTVTGTSLATNIVTSSLTAVGTLTNLTVTNPINGTAKGINGVQTGSLATGILKNTTTTGVPSIAVAADFPVLNQNTTGSAATLTTARTINGVAFDGSANITVPADGSTVTGISLATNIVTSSLTTVGTLTNLTVTNPINGTAKGINGVQTGSLATGILKNTTTTGVPSIAVAADFPVLNQNTTGSAATLTTARTINGVAFNGSANITVPADAGTLTGTSLATGVTSSVLTSVGTLGSLTVSTPIVGSITGNAATVTTNANLTGNVTSVGNSTTIANNVVSNAMLSNINTNTIKGRSSVGIGSVEDLSATTVTSMLDLFSSANKGLVPLSGGGTTNFLRADGTWSAPSGGGGSGTVTQVTVTTANGFSGTVDTNTTTPAITIIAGAITPTSVVATGAVTGSNLSGTNTGDQTSVTGNAGTATALQTARTINGVSFDGTANITIPAANTALSNLASVAINTDLLLGVSDGGALGSATKMWSDLFLASGAVINFNNSNTAITHSANQLAISGGGLALAAGTTTLAPAKYTSGTNLSTAQAGAVEFDGTAFYKTVDTTNGRSQDSNQQIFRLVANGAAIGPGIADYFGANSSIPTVTNGIYEITFVLFYLKTTAGTVTYTLTNTQTYTNLVAKYEQTAVGGIATAASPVNAAIVGTTTAAAAMPATGSLTTGANHSCIIRCIAECSVAGNIRLRVTSSAGTITPLRGSYFTVRRIAAGNVGTFAA